MLDPRAIALEGLGFSPRLIAVRGLWPDDTIPPVAHVHTDAQVTDALSFNCSVSDSET